MCINLLWLTLRVPKLCRVKRGRHMASSQAGKRLMEIALVPSYMHHFLYIWMSVPNHIPDCLVASWEGPQLLLAKIIDTNRQDWYILD